MTKMVNGKAIITPMSTIDPFSTFISDKFDNQSIYLL